MTGRTVRHARASALLAVGLSGLIVSAPARASHPLISEDTEVLEKGGFEFEVHGEHAHVDGSQGIERPGSLLFKLGYGLTETVAVEVELPYLREIDDGVVKEGRADLVVAAKWRFYEKNGFSMAVKPEIALPTGEEELRGDHVRWAATLSAAYDFGRIELLGNLAYAHNPNDSGERSSLRRQSIAARFAATSKLKLVADLVRQSTLDPESAPYARELVLGATYALTAAIDLGLGFKKWLNDVADDQGVRAGIKLRW
jgi:hypothetical protein